MKVTTLVVSLLLSATAVRAQFPIALEKVLLPVHVTTPLPGIGGSLFRTHFSLVNTASERVRVEGFDPLCQILCPILEPTLLAPGVTYVEPPLSNWVSRNEGIQGFFLRVDARLVRALKFSLRAKDVSRQAATYGTEIPMIRESDALQAKSSLLSVPIAPQFRVMLRLYDFDSSPTNAAHVRIYQVDPSQRPASSGHVADETPDRLLFETTLSFRVAASGQGREAHPGYAELPNLSFIPRLLGAELVRIEIEPASPGLRYWAFATVTHNETQHITVITPNPE